MLNISEFNQYKVKKKYEQHEANISYNDANIIDKSIV